MLFDGVDDYVDLNILPDDLMTTSVFDISFDIMWESSGIASYDKILQFSTTTGFFRLQRTLNTNNIALWTRKGAGLDIISSTNISVTPDVKHTMRLLCDGVTFSAYVDGVLNVTRSVDAANLHTPTWTAVQISEASTNCVKGVIYNWSLDTVSVKQLLLGTGNTDADWTDQIGSNHGTVNGSPALLINPDPTLDVTGLPLTNPSVAPRPNDSESTEDWKNLTESGTPTAATNDYNVALETVAFDEDLSSFDYAFLRRKSIKENDRGLSFTTTDLTEDAVSRMETYTNDTV